MFAIGTRGFAFQGHPEFTREVMVGQIIPGARADGRLDEAGERAALSSLDQPIDSAAMLRVIRRFLDGPPGSE
jgi:hypothetical protein